MHLALFLSSFLAVSLTLATPAEAADDVLIEGVPHVERKSDFGGEAAVTMWLKKLGHRVDQDFVFDQTGVDPELGRGAWTRELVEAVKRLGFDPGQVWWKVDAMQAASQVEARWKDLYEDLRRGIPSIICASETPGSKSAERFRLVLGYDAATDQVIYHDPAVANGAYLRMPRSRFLTTWPLRYVKLDWTLVRIRLKGVKVRPTTIADEPTRADYAQAVRKVRGLMPADGGFTVVLVPPFVVVGDGPAAAVHRRAAGTVNWSVDKLKDKFFEKGPAKVIAVWLFKDDASYRKHTREIFGHNPDTPFGYYSDRAQALIMNIATGGGTLVHEIVHPFVEADFPSAPAWLNEGMGSLYEQCTERNGQIWGLTNWRLAGLQEAIKAKELPSFRELTKTTSDEFYDEDPGTNYAQSRYLLYYLQEIGKLPAFYKAFRALAKSDPTGYATLKRYLGAKDMKKFQERWEAWVLSLQFP